MRMCPLYAILLFASSSILDTLYELWLNLYLLQWAVYSRNIVRTSNGLKLIADLLNNSHDSVVRAAATAIRNLSIDPRNKASLGEWIILCVLKYSCKLACLQQNKVKWPKKRILKL